MPQPRRAAASIFSADFAWPLTSTTAQPDDFSHKVFANVTALNRGRREPAGPPWIADVKRHNDIGVIDGVPMAYKDIDSVVATQRELVEVVCAVIALHAALQGFMALTLDRGNGFLVMSKKDAAAWLSEHQQGRSSKQCRPWIVS